MFSIQYHSIAPFQLTTMTSILDKYKSMYILKYIPREDAGFKSRIRPPYPAPSVS